MTMNANDTTAYPKPMTFFIDLDGTVFKHMGRGQADQTEAQVISGAREAIDELLKYGHYIILTTGRREAHREHTVKQLHLWCISYDQLVMGLPPGTRVVVNDRKPDGSVTAGAISHTRDTIDWAKICVDLGRGQSGTLPR